MGIEVTKPTPIYVDNMSDVMNASNPASTLNKKHIALAYHFVREHVANNVIEIRKIPSKDNYADAWTKGLARDSPGVTSMISSMNCNQTETKASTSLYIF